MSNCAGAGKLQVSPLRRKSAPPVEMTVLGWGRMKDEACGSEVWGFGSDFIGRVETLPYPILAMVE